MRVDCEKVAADDLAEKYLLGELDPAEQDAYELHYFECERCFGDLQRLQTIRRTLQEGAVSSPVRVSPPARAVWWRWVAAGAAAASIGVLALVLQSGVRDQVAVNSPLAPPPSTIEPAVPRAVPDRDEDLADRPVTVAREPSAPSASPHSRSAPSVPQRAEVLARLAEIAPPHYSPRILRGSLDDAAVSFREGMKAYVASDYASAVPHLSKAAILDPSRPDIQFYLGAAELLVGDTADAVTAFRTTIAMGETPFLDEAHFYLGKAYLARGEIPAARVELELAARSTAVNQHEAKAILSELNTLEPN